MTDQQGAALVARLEAIESSVRPVLDGKRWWLTAEEFLALVEAHRRKHDQERSNPKAINHEPAATKDYVLKPFATFTRQRPVETQEVAS